MTSSKGLLDLHKKGNVFNCKSWYWGAVLHGELGIQNQEDVPSGGVHHLSVSVGEEAATLHFSKWELFPNTAALHRYLNRSSDVYHKLDSNTNKGYIVGDFLFTTPYQKQRKKVQMLSTRSRILNGPNHSTTQMINHSLR